MICKSCAFDGSNKIYQLREMQLGTRELFNYQECSNCGCMQLTDIPDDLSVYYPADQYYSFNTTQKKEIKKDWLRSIKAAYLIYGSNKLMGSLLSLGYKAPAYFDWIKTAGVAFDDSILDIGCGDGGLLVSLYKNGFTNLQGIDPFNTADLDYGDIKILKKSLFEINGQYDFIMLNHVFEHLDEPKKVLQQLYALLKPGRFLLVRTPVMGTYAWKKYRENWLDLDAPRHIIIHTIKSMQILAVATGFNITKTVFDETAANLIASEQYSRDIPLNAANSYFKNKEKAVFSAADIKAFEKTAQQNNASGQGAQAAFFLYKP